jgi:hypothetical protein
MKAIEKLKEKRFSVEITRGNFYAQNSEVEFFSTKEEAEEFYNKSEISQSEMEEASWSKNGEQPDFKIELRELQSVPIKMIDELEEDAEEMESEILDIYHTYSVRLKTKSYFFNKDAVVFDYDEEDMKEEKGKMERWKLIEYEGSDYSTLPFSEDVISLVDGSVSKMKGFIE